MYVVLGQDRLERGGLTAAAGKTAPRGLTGLTAGLGGLPAALALFPWRF